jgi:phage-related holin
MKNLTSYLISNKTDGLVGHFNQAAELFNYKSGWALITVSYFSSLLNILGLAHKFFFSDWVFLALLSTLVLIDTVLGFMVAIKDRIVGSFPFSKVFVKVIVSGAFLQFLHVASHNAVDGQPINHLDWIRPFGYTLLIVREGISIGENSGKLGHPIWPKWFIGKLKDFRDNGKLTKPEIKEDE